MTQLPRTALVTGCSTGIGRATAIGLHRAGFTVYATARDTATVADLAEDRLHVLALDVTDEASMTAALAAIGANGHTVDVLVNNAGYAVQGPAEETPLADVRAMFEVNVLGLTRITQLVLPSMRAHGRGRIINVGSMGGRFTFPGGAFYHASKHAVEAISDALRLEVRAFGVHVSLIEPGPVRTSFAATALGFLGDANGPYDEFRTRLTGTFASTYNAKGGGLLEPRRVARTIVRAATSRRPRARYTVGWIAKALVSARRVLPDVLWDRFVRSIYPVPGRPR